MIDIKKIVITIAILLLVSCGGSEDRVESYLEKAKHSMSQNDTVKAKIDLKNVLQINPKNSEARYLLGTIAENNKDYRKAFSFYEKAIELDESNIDARYRLGRIYLQLGEIDKSLHEVVKINSVKPDHIYARSLQAAIKYSEKKFLETIEIISTINPEEILPEIYELYSASLYQAKKTDEALDVLKMAVNRYPKNEVLRVRLLKYYEMLSDNESVIKEYENLIAIDPEKVDYYVALSTYHERNGDKDKADAVYRNLVQENPENEKYKLLLFQYLLTKVGNKEGTEYLKSLIDTEPDVEIYALTLARLHLKYKRREEATKLVNNVIEKGLTAEGVSKAKNLLAEMLIGDKKIEKAETILKEVIASSPNNVDANLMLGKLYISRNRADDAVNPLRLVIKETPDFGDAYLLLSIAHEKQKNINLAEDVLKRGLLVDSDNIKIIKSYVKILADKGQYDFAIKLLARQSSSTNKSNRTELMRLMSLLYIKNNEPEKAEKIGNQLIESNSNDETGYVILSTALTAQKQIEKANVILKRGYETTKTPRLLIGFIQNELSLGRVDEAFVFLGTVDKYKEVASSLLGEIYSIKGDTAQSIKSFRNAIKLKPAWDTPYYALANQQKSLKKYDDAIETYKAALEKLDHTLKTRFLMASTYQKMGKIVESVKYYESIVNDDPSNHIAANNLAQILVDEYDDQDSFARALKLVEAIKDSANIAVQDTTGWVYSRNGMHDQAIEVLTTIVEQRPDIAIFKYHLGIAHHRKGNGDNAKIYLNEAISMTSKENWYQDAKQILDSMNK